MRGFWREVASRNACLAEKDERVERRKMEGRRGKENKSPRKENFALNYFIAAFPPSDAKKGEEGREEGKIKKVLASFDFPSCARRRETLGRKEKKKGGKGKKKEREGKAGKTTMLRSIIRNSVQFIGRNIMENEEGEERERFRSTFFYTIYQSKGISARREGPVTEYRKKKEKKKKGKGKSPPFRRDCALAHLLQLIKKN